MGRPDARRVLPEQAPGTWLPLSTDWRERNVSQLDEPGSLLQLYRRLLAARRSPSLRWGGFSLLPPPGMSGLSKVRSGSLLRWWWRSTWVRAGCGRIACGKVLVATDRGREGIVVSGAVELAGNEGVVIEQS